MPYLRSPVGHTGASRLRISDHLSRYGRSHVMVLLAEAPPGAEDTDDADDDVPDDENEPLQNFRRCLEAMADGRTLKKLRFWRKAYFELKGARK